MTVRSAARFTPELTEQHAVRAQRSSKKRQTKPIEISHKSLVLKELTSNGFGPLYAKQTQFRVVEAATIGGLAMSEAGTQTITAATKIGTNPDNRFRQATSNRGSRGIRDQPRNSPTHTQKREFGRSYAVGRFSTATGVEMRGPGNLGSDTEGPRTPHAPQIDSCVCTSVNQLRNSYEKAIVRIC